MLENKEINLLIFLFSETSYKYKISTSALCIVSLLSTLLTDRTIQFRIKVSKNDRSIVV